MPPRSKIDLLPEQIRKELERRLIGSAFGDCRGLSAWLQSEGYEISKTTINEWGQDFEARMRAVDVATRQAKAIVDASPDDEGAMNDALMRLVQQQLIELLINFKIDTSKPVNLGTIAKAVAELARASVAQKKWAAEVRDKGGAVIEEMGKAAGMSNEETAKWRQRLMGVVPG